MNKNYFFRVFKDNKGYKNNKYLPYADALANTVLEYLYSDKVESDDYNNFRLDNRINLYDFMSIATHFICVSVGEFGKATFIEYINDIKINRGTNHNEDIIVYYDNSILLTQASYEMLLNIIWTAYIYANFIFHLGKGQDWKNASDMLYSILKEKSNLTEDVFKKLPIIQNSKEAITYMIEYITRSSKPNDNINMETCNNNDSEKIIKENSELKKELNKLQEIIDLQKEEMGNIDADSKIGLSLIVELMKKNGANFEKQGNKVIATKALKMMTGRSESACKSIFSAPLSKTYPPHKQKIKELNGYLRELGMETLL